MDQNQETTQDPVGSATQAVALPEPRRAPDGTSDIFPFEFEEPLPTSTDPSFQEFIPGSPGRTIPNYAVTEEEYIPITGEQDFASFGDEGTTATLNAYGTIVQITRYLGAGRSGFFSVDLEDVDEPYLVQSRADQLMKRCANPDGIYFAPDAGSCQELDDCYEQPWQLNFVHNRWPRFTSDTSGTLVITSQNFASQGTIFQTDRYEATNRRVQVISGSSTRFCRNWIKLRELEFLDPEYKFNERDDWDDYLGPNGYSFILVKKGIIPDSRVTHEKEFPDAVGLICAISVNGQIRELEKAFDEGPCYRVKLTSEEDGFWAGPNEPLFAFEFLLSMYEHIEKQHDDSCNCNQRNDTACRLEFLKALCSRIKKTCEGQLIWIKQAKLDEAGCFETHYWASGEKIEIFEPDREVLSMRSVTDTPFQIIKLADFTSRFGKDNEMLQECLERFIRPWIKNLDKVNRLGFYVFPRPPRLSHAEYQNYRLEDHVWIWRALQGINTLNFDNELSEEKRVRQRKKKGQKGKTNEEEPLSDMDRLTWDYSPTEFQRHVLRRFTAQNIVSRKRMLAVARSSSENRFLLRARDTALFYETKVPFFNESDSLWKATMDAQVLHEENQDSTWDSPLRYGLALMMATKGFQINSKHCDYMSQIAKDCLFQSSSGGLFPGQLNIGTKESEIYEHERWRDFYWHVTFEVPYILWENSQREEEIEYFAKHRKQDDPSSPQATRTAVNLPIQDQPGGSRALEMKRSMPSNSFIEQQSIVEISDEWLYPYPDFLDFKPSTEMTPTTIDEFKREIDPASFIQDAEASFCREHSPWEDCASKCVVIDIPKTNHGVKGKRGPQDDPVPENTTQGLCSHYLYKRLIDFRTAKDAKKRLVWVPIVDRNIALLCVVLSPKSERAYLASFFDRYERREKYFFDETAATSNLWRTELHLSSYRLLQGGEDTNKSTSNTDLRFLGGGRKIRRSGMSFRFVGDFFDRYWTCHILGYGPQNDQPARQSKTGRRRDEAIEVQFRNLIDSGEFFHKIERDKKPWRQRKVLELLLFDSMLQGIISGYDELLKEVDRHLRRMLSLGQPADAASSDILSVSNALFSSQMDSHAYLTVSKEWPPFQYTLQIMEEDLQETLDKIELWRSREEDRAPESPRWTRNDESKYRSVINKLKASNVYRIRDVERHLSKIQSLRTALTNRLASIRDDLNFQSAENVRFFTYVTVVFLPLGFAAAIFSMNGAPPKTPLIGMVVTAVVALILTVIALANAQTLDETIFTPGYRALGKFKPRSGAARKRQRNRTVDEAQVVQLHDGQQQGRENSPAALPPVTATPSSGKWSLNLKALPEKYRTFRQRRNNLGGEPDDPSLEAGKADHK